MNKIYKVIWSKVRNCYVAVSEIAKRNGKSCTSVNCGAKANRGRAGVGLSAAVGATLLAGVCSVLLPVCVALAAPVMPTLDVNGKSAAVTIASTSSATSATMNINSTQGNNVLKWIDFSIGKGGTVQFDPNNYLNYVTGHGRSEIDGILKQTKNNLGNRGSIYIVNPNGVLFGDNARVDVGSLYVSTRELGADQFSAFEEGGNPLTMSDLKGDVVNLGKLNADTITVEGNNITFKNIADVTKGGTLTDGDITGGTAHDNSSVTLTANSAGEIHIGSSNGETPAYSMSGTDKKYMYTLVSTPEQLQAIGEETNLSGNYMLANDIDLKNGDDYIPFKPIGYTKKYLKSDNVYGTKDLVFTGRFDGLNYKIKNLKITDDTLSSLATADDTVDHNIGLFGINSGTIENIGVVDTEIEVSKETVGGIVGWNYYSGIIRNVYHTGSVIGNNNQVGGIAGASFSLIENAYNTGTIDGSGFNIGGIVGTLSNQATIRNVYNTGAVGTHGNRVGGIVGDSLSGTVIDAYNTGTVTSTIHAGGIVGQVGGTTSIQNSYNIGIVNGNSSSGGIVGCKDGALSITSSFSNNGSLSNGGVLKTDDELKQTNTFADWSISNTGGAKTTWRISEGQTTPQLTAFLKTKDYINKKTYDGTADVSTTKSNGTMHQKEGLAQGFDYVQDVSVIEPKELTVTFADISKTYDGTTSATPGGGTLSGGIISDDDVMLYTTGIVAVYADKNAGTGNKTVNYSGIALTGTKAGNYSILDTAQNTTSTITPKTLSLANVSKEYDGTANVEAGDIALATGIIDGDDAEFNSSNVTGLYEDENVNVSGSKAVTYTINTGALTGADAGNYIISTAGLGDIIPRTVTLDGTISKVYDGTNTATPTVNALSNVIEADKAALSISATSATYSDVNVGDDLTVTYEGLQLGGTKAGNYAIASTGANVPGNSITPKELTATFNTISKIYDGGKSGTANTSLTGVVGSDDVSVTATATYLGQDVGTWGVNYTGIGLTGHQAGNYVLDSTSAADKTVEGNSITVKALTVGNISKVYDGTAEAKLTLDNLIGLVDGDKTSLSISEGVTANYTGENAADFGAGKIVEYSGLTLGGEKSGNYTIAVNGTTTGNIDKRVLTASSVSKVYDGTDTATLHLSDLLGTDGLPGVVERDESDLVLTTSPATYGNKNAGIYDNVTFSGISLTGSLTGDKSHNYTINGSITVRGTITRKALELVAKEVTIRENEQIPSTFDGSIIGFIDGEGQNISGLVFSLANPMTTPVVGSYRIVGTLNGDESGDYGLNYTFQNAASNATAFTVKPILAVLPALDFRGASVWAASVNVTIDKSKENKLLIDSTKPYNTLKWIDFSIGENGTVQFDDKNYLNYVTGHGRSDIDGTLTGGGAIYLINPNGVLFGSTAQVDVGNLYVSSRTLDNTALNAFETDGTNPLETPPVSATGNIINRGKLKAAGITVEGNNVSFKNVEDVTATGTEGIKVRADGEVHVGYAASAEVTAVNPTEYTAESVHRPDEAFAKWSVKKLNGTDDVDTEKYTEYMLVRNAYELQNMKNNLLGNYMLANDIEFKNDDGGYVIGQFIPIGSLGGWTDYREGMFKGKLDGLYHVIRDIYIDNTAITQNSNRLTDIGIIGSNAGIVENLGVINGNVNITNSGASAVGGIVGANKPDGIIRNVYFSGSVKGGRSGTGGIAGWQNTGGLTENAYATGTVTSSSGNPDSIFGVIGVASGSIKNSYFSGIVKNQNMYMLYKSDGTRQTLTSMDSMKQLTTFNSTGVGWDITADGSKNATWRIYEGKTTPLLTAFLKTKSLVTEREYNGYVQGFDQTLVTGDSQVNVYSDSDANYAEGRNAGVYEGTKTFYSDSQQGYNIVDTKLVIQPKKLRLDNTKVYDGTTSVTATAIGLKSSDIIDNDVVGLELDNSKVSGLYADKNVGENKAVTYTIADDALGGEDEVKKNNYILTVKGTGTITPIAITASFAEISKVYDGTINDVDGTGTAVASRTGTLTGVLEADTGKVSVTGKALYADKNAGTEKTVNYSNVALGGGETEDESGNYVLSSTSATGKGKIDKREISVVFGDISKIYDGLTTSDTIGARTFTNVIAADTGKVDVTATATYDEKNAGSRTVSYTGITLTGTGAGNEAGNYSIADTGTGAGTIYKREISVAFGDINKTYDGLTTSDTIGERTFTNVIADDEGKVDVTATATYDKKNAGNRSVAYTTIALTGGETEDESGNYVLSSTSATGKGKIDKREISVSFGAISKTYDGLTTSDTIGARTFTNVIAADADKVDVTATATYDKKNAGSRTVSYAEIALTGSEAGNYSLTHTTASSTGTIDKKSVTATFADISKIYDGTTNATPGAGTLTGVIAADEGKVNVSASAAYDEKNAGSRTVNYTGVTLSGAEAGNYSIATTATGNGTIGRKALELVADPASTEYGDYNPASFTGRVDGFVTGESVSNGDTLLFALSDPSASAVGSYGITGTINGSSSGDYGLNYTFTNAASNANAFTIYARPASVQDMVLSDIIPGIKGKSGADISVTALDNAMEQARDKRAEVGIEFAVAQTILSVDADRNLSLENRGMKQPPAMTPQEVAEQVHAQQGKGNGVAAQAGGNAGAASGGTNENGAASNAGVTGAVNAAMDVVQQTDDAVGTEESKRKKGVA